MSEKPYIHILKANKDPSIPDNSADTGRCPNCAGETEVGFGCAGGGYGEYTYCERCEIIVTKTDEEESPDDERDGRGSAKRA